MYSGPLYPARPLSFPFLLSVSLCTPIPSQYPPIREPCTCLSITPHCDFPLSNILLPQPSYPFSLPAPALSLPPYASIQPAPPFFPISLSIIPFPHEPYSFIIPLSFSFIYIRIALTFPLLIPYVCFIRYPCSIPCSPMPNTRIPHIPRFVGDVL